MLEVEAWLHSLGYLYTGPGCLYGVTFIEIYDLMEGMSLLRFSREGVTVGEQDMLEQFAEALA